MVTNLFSQTVARKYFQVQQTGLFYSVNIGVDGINMAFQVHFAISLSLYIYRSLFLIISLSLSPIIYFLFDFPATTATITTSTISTMIVLTFTLFVLFCLLFSFCLSSIFFFFSFPHLCSVPSHLLGIFASACRPRFRRLQGLWGQ